MPIYEYQCEACGHQMEAMQRMSDDPLKDCPSCGASSLRKLVSAAGFRLKGTGWYVTDFRDKGKKTAKADAAKGEGEGSKADGGEKASDKSSGGESAKESTSAGDKKETVASKGAKSSGGGED